MNYKTSPAAELFLKRKAQSSQTDAIVAYREKIREVKDLMHQLANSVQKHAVAQASNTKNWGYVGDLEEAVKELRELVQFMGHNATQHKLG